MTKTVDSLWIVKETTVLEELVITNQAEIKPVEGKNLTFTAGGVLTELKPGTYRDAVLSVTQPYVMGPSGLFRFTGRSTEFRQAVCIENGVYTAEKSVPAAILSGTVADGVASDVCLRGNDEITGFVVDGGRYRIENLSIDLDGDGGNDFIGLGSGVCTVGDAQVEIDGADINFRGVTRCAVHVGGHSKVQISNSKFTNFGPAATPKMRAAWMMGLDGTNRLTQLTDCGTVTYTNCELRSNGWGVMSVDGSDKCRMYMKDCLLELIEPPARGYGAFSIGDCWIYYDHCRMNINGYPILMNTEDGGGAEFSNGCEVTGDMYGAMIFRDMGGTLNCADSTFRTGLSTFLVKGSNAFVNVKNCVLQPGNGIILQLMDSDEPGMFNPCFKPPIGEVDTPIEGRDLTAADPKEDVFLTLTDLTAKGDILNSTTDLKANCRHYDDEAGITIKTGVLKDVDLNYDENGHSDASAATEAGNHLLQGVKNLDVRFTNAHLEGVISSACQKWADGVTKINGDNHHELNNITQWAAPTVNNGVIVTLDASSSWTVTGTSYITKLVIADGAQVIAETMTVDGVKTPIVPGTYTGKIILA